MANRRARIQAFYRNPESLRALLTETQASAATQYQFHGAALKWTVVARCDLNGYSAWARDKQIGDRVQLLDSFFSRVVPLLAQHGGIFFRDEGDCIVCIFSDYFGAGATPSGIDSFCKNVVSQTYGRDQLSAKVVVACGAVAYFQKAHEVGSDDWSAEGAPFVTAARLENAVKSGQHVTFLKEDYDRQFVGQAPAAAYGQRYYWSYVEDKLQVPGLGLAGGWTDVVRLDYIAGGRVAA